MKIYIRLTILYVIFLMCSRASAVDTKIGKHVFSLADRIEATVHGTRFYLTEQEVKDLLRILERDMRENWWASEGDLPEEGAVEAVVTVSLFKVVKKKERLIARIPLVPEFFLRNRHDPAVKLFFDSKKIRAKKRGVREESSP